MSPSTDFVFTSPGHNIPELSQDQTINFTLVTHTISGKVSNVTGATVAGATITLSGSNEAIGTTDSTGNYSFANVPAGGTYTITASKPNYTITPGAVTLSDSGFRSNPEFLRKTELWCSRLAVPTELQSRYSFGCLYYTRTNHLTRSTSIPGG